MASVQNATWAGTHRDRGVAPPAYGRSYEDFWALWSRNDELLRRLSLRWLEGHHANAEDALSMAKLKAISHFCSSTVTLVNAKAWLARLLYTTCMDIHRQRCRETHTAEDLEAIESADNPPMLLPSPEEELLGRERGRRVVELFDELPRPWHEALVERCVHRKPYSVIAHESGTTRANVRKRVQLARAFLRERL